MKYAISVLLLFFGIGARAENVLTITGGSGTPGEEVTVSFALANADAVSALQLSIPLDEELSLVSNSVVKTARLENHDASASVKDGYLNVMVYSLQMATIAAGEGELFSLKLKVGSQPKDIVLTPSTLKLTGGSGAVEATSQAGTVSIRCAKAQYSTMTVDFGEVPIRDTYTETVMVTNVGNEPLTVTALTFSDATTLSSTTTLPFTVAAGDSAPINVTYAPTVRGTISETLKVTCNSTSKLNTIQIAAQPFAVNELHVQDASGVSDTEVEVVLSMNNMDPIIGFQAVFELPDALEYVSGSFGASPDPSQGGESRWTDHIGGATLQGNTLTILVYSPSGQPFNDNDGVLGSFRVKLVGRYGVTLTPTVAKLTAVLDGVSTDVCSAKYEGYVDIQSPQLGADSDLDFGRMSVTGDVEQQFTICNNGSAPLTVSRIVFADAGYSVTETLPLTINAWDCQAVTVVKTDKTEGDFATTMNIYSNDPDQRLWSVGVTGNIYAPNFLTVTADDVYLGDDVPLHVSLDNYDPVYGLQFDISAPEAYGLSQDDVVTTERGSGLSVSSNRLDDSTIRVVGYQLDGAAIAAGSGELLTLKLTPESQQALGQHEVSVKNVKLGASKMVDKNADPDTQYISYTAMAANNSLSAASISIPKGGQATLEVTCSFENTMVGGQLDIKLPDDWKVTPTMSGGRPVVTLGFTGTNHSLSNTQCKDASQNLVNTYRSLCTSMNNSPLPRSGVLLRIPLNASADAEVGTVYNAKLTGIEFGTKTMTYTLADVPFTITIAKGAIRGDANDDGNVTVTDIAVVVNCILRLPNNGGFSEYGADANGDGQITVTDIGVIVDKILGTSNSGNAGSRKMQQERQELEPQ